MSKTAGPILLKPAIWRTDAILQKPSTDFCEEDCVGITENLIVIPEKNCMREEPRVDHMISFSSKVHISVRIEDGQSGWIITVS